MPSPGATDRWSRLDILASTHEPRRRRPRRAERRLRLRGVRRLDRAAGAQPLRASGRGRDRAVQREQRDPRHADGLREVAGRDRGAFRGARRRSRELLHRADQSARVGEVLRLVRDLRCAQRRHAHRRRVRQQRRPDHLLHGGDPGQHRAARRHDRGRRPGRDGRVPLLRRSAARVGVAGAAAQPPAGPVPADVGDARRHDRAARGPLAAHRARHGADRELRTPGAAVLLMVAGAAARTARGARADRPGADLRRALHAGVRARAGPVAAVGEAVHARGARRDRGCDRWLPLHRRVRPDAFEARPERDRRPSRRHAAALPPARGAARADRVAEGGVRDRHARRRYQRPDPHGRLHRAGEVRRHQSPDP